MNAVRAIRVSDRTVVFELPRAMATCAMWCRYCPRTAADAPRDLPAPAPADVRRVLQELGALMFQHRVPEVTLVGDDVLGFPGLDRLLDALRFDHRRVHLVTPGLALADLEVARRFVGHDLRFDLTVHSLDPAVSLAMCGNPAAHDAILQGIDNLAALGIAFELGTVVTDVNVGTLADTLIGLAARYRPETFHVRVYYPDARDLPPGFVDQFPAFDAVLDQLERVDREVEAPPVIKLANLPLCQLDLERFSQLRIVPTADQNTYRVGDLPVCAACPAAPTCPRVHPSYQVAHPWRAPDLDQVRRAFERLEAERPRVVAEGAS